MYSNAKGEPTGLEVRIRLPGTVAAELVEANIGRPAVALRSVPLGDVFSVVLVGLNVTAALITIGVGVPQMRELYAAWRGHRKDLQSHGVSDAAFRLVRGDAELVLESHLDAEEAARQIVDFIESVMGEGEDE